MGLGGGPGLARFAFSMLEDGFKEELTEIVRHCPRGRQTMLFSASMTDDVGPPVVSVRWPA